MKFKYEPVNFNKKNKSNTSRKANDKKENIDLNSKDEWKPRKVREPVYYAKTSVDRIL
jgi:hypothetical protein